LGADDEEGDWFVGSVVPTTIGQKKSESNRSWRRDHGRESGNRLVATSGSSSVLSSFARPLVSSIRSGFDEWPALRGEAGSWKSIYYLN